MDRRHRWSSAANLGMALGTMDTLTAHRLLDTLSVCGIPTSSHPDHSYTTRQVARAEPDGADVRGFSWTRASISLIRQNRTYAGFADHDMQLHEASCWAGTQGCVPAGQENFHLA